MLLNWNAREAYIKKLASYLRPFRISIRMREKKTLSFTVVSQIVTKKHMSLLLIVFSMIFRVYAHHTEHLYHTSPEEDSFVFKTIKDIHSESCLLFLSLSFSYPCGRVYLFGLFVRIKPKVNGQNYAISGYVLWLSWL